MNTRSITGHDDLEYDIRNLAVLIETVTEMAIDFPADNLGDLRDHVNKIGSLLWIARSLTAQLGLDAADIHPLRMTEDEAEPRDTETEIASLYRQWVKSREFDPSTMTEDECDARCEAAALLQKRIAELPQPAPRTSQSSSSPIRPMMYLNTQMRSFRR